ncbi:hypothetical protein ACIBJC_28515 [Streptomyces sp. NPDC050509]|uniref:hypothetical protein n=1 Tax=Streptomyces sp. NPDC050509 TaxID=3365620 RepID=UPI0037B86663
MSSSSSEPGGSGRLYVGSTQASTPRFRFTETELIAETSAGFDQLYARGEEHADFFDREIAPLPPPVALL